MYPSSTSSSSQGSLGPNTSLGSGGLARYGSAPGSLFKTAVDSVIQNQTPLRFLSEASESSSKSNLNDHSYSRGHHEPGKTTTTTNTAIGLQRSYEFPSSSSSSSSSLVRHSSSPAGFLNHLATTAAAGDNGFSITRGIGSSYNSKGMGESSSVGISRLNSPLSFAHPKESLSRISEDEAQNVADRKSSSHHSNYAGFGMTSSWDGHATNTHHSFSIAPPKRVKTLVNDLEAIESQFQFGMPQASLEMSSSMDKLLHIPQDSVPCKIRAKRGCATHPRSIAERERRTRISGKLKKLQDLVPNMDKQTSYADMLDLAVQHIKVLQNQVQKLKKEVNDCTCGGCNNKEDS